MAFLAFVKRINPIRRPIFWAILAAFGLGYGWLNSAVKAGEAEAACVEALYNQANEFSTEALEAENQALRDQITELQTQYSTMRTQRDQARMRRTHTQRLLTQLQEDRKHETPEFNEWGDAAVPRSERMRIKAAGALYSVRDQRSDQVQDGADRPDSAGAEPASGPGSN